MTVTAQSTLTPKGEASRQRLLQAAADQLVAGEGAFELSSVATDAGVSVGLCYRYFGSKAGLIAAVVADYFDRFAAVFYVERNPGQDWLEQGRKRTANTVDFFYADPLGRIVLTLLAREPDVVVVQRACMDKLIDGTTTFIKRGKKAGFIPAHVDPELTAAMILGGMLEGLAAGVSRVPRPSRSRLSQQLWAFVGGALQLSPAQA